MAGAGFGMRVLGFDPFVSRNVMTRHAVEKCDSLAALLREADFVSLHAVFC